jgi:prepilin-type N-terminal cleavage/methylation domain-containing protein
MRSKKGFTLIELMVVILIIGILAAVAVPLMRGRIDRAKWSEANAGCGTVWTALRAYIAEKGPAFDFSGIDGPVTGAVGIELGFNDTDLEGTYFAPGDYSIGTVVADPPSCVITVTPSKGNAPGGSATFTTSDPEPFEVTP